MPENCRIFSKKYDALFSFDETIFQSRLQMNVILGVIILFFLIEFVEKRPHTFRTISYSNGHCVRQGKAYVTHHRLAKVAQSF